MDCRSCLEALTALIDGELAPGEKPDVERHVAGCAACSAEYRSMRESFELTRQLVSVEPSTELWNGIAAELSGRRPPLPTTRLQRWFFRPWVPVSAVGGALAVLLAVGLWPSSDPVANRFEEFYSRRERLFQQQREILFRHEWLDRYRQVRNPFSRPIAQIGYNPFQE